MADYKTKDIRIIALHVQTDALYGPDAFALGRQFCQPDTAGAECEGVGIFFRHVFLLPEESADPRQCDAPDLFFDHVYHLKVIIQETGPKRKRKIY